MPKILYHRGNVEQNDLLPYEDLLEEIALPNNTHPQAKKLKGVHYNNLDVYRVKTDKKGRIVYMYVDGVLLILSVLKDHNYDKLNRQLKGLEAYMKEHHETDESEADKAEVPAANMDQKKQKAKFDWTPVTPYGGMYLELDEGQGKVLQSEGAVILMGPPGSGKTAVVATMMLNWLKHLKPKALPATAAAPAENTSKELSVLFVSASAGLVENLKSTYTPVCGASVEFTTWKSLLHKHYPGLSFVAKDAFEKVSRKIFPDLSAQSVHTEVSLLAALGKEKYVDLKLRQSHFSGKKEQQAQLIKLHAYWDKYLKDNKLIDPMVTKLPEGKKYTIFCDETQNLPPTALLSLMEWTEGTNFVASLDSEQCFLTSPFIHNCLKTLAHQKFTDLTEHHLEHTWRCPPAVTAVSNHLRDAKHKLDGGRNRRSYKTMKSVQENNPGLVSWVDDKHLGQLIPYGALASTVVIVAKVPSKEERTAINKATGSNNILTAAQAIGLDFKTVILWRLLSQGVLKNISQLSAASDGLSIEQWYALNALYVAITRAQSAVFVCEPRLLPHSELLLGALLANKFNAPLEKSTKEEENKKWELQAQQHLDEERYEEARQIMIYYLKYSEEAADKRIAEAKALHQVTIVAASNSVAEVSPQDYKSASAVATTKVSKKPKVKEEALVPVTAGKKNEKESTTTTVSTDEDRTKYIKGILANPKKYLKTFLGVSDKKLELYLFTHRLGDGTNLFRQLVTHKELHPILLQNLREDFIKKYLTKNIVDKAGKENVLVDRTDLMVFGWFFQYKESLGIEFLFQHRFTDGSNLFQRLAQQQSGREIVFPLLQNLSKKIISEHFTKEILTAIYPKTVHKSLLYWLAVTAVGRELLAYLVKAASNVEKMIDVSVFCHPRSYNMSPLYLLTSDAKGWEVLMSLVDNGMLNEIPAEIWCLPVKRGYTGANNSSYVSDCSPLFNLTTTTEGVYLLDRLLKRNKALAAGITATALCRPLSPGTPASGNESPLLYLSSSRSRCQEILLALLESNSALAKGISIEALSLPLTDPSNRGVCPLYLLAQAPTGIQILKLLLDSNPQFAVVSDDSGLTRVVTLSKKPADTWVNESAAVTISKKSAYDWLMESPAGSAVAIRLVARFTLGASTQQTATAVSAATAVVPPMSMFGSSTQSAAGITVSSAQTPSSLNSDSKDNKSMGGPSS